LKKRLRSIIEKALPGFLIAFLVLVWHVVTELGLIKPFLLPSPTSVFWAFFNNFERLMQNATTSLLESLLGLALALAVAVVLALAMERFNLVEKMVFPVLVITQTIPVVAIAPLLIMWLDTGIEPKVALIFIVCFFPITVGLLTGLKSAEPEAIRLLKSMGANQFQILRHLKFPSALESFFSGIKIAVSYAIVGAIIAEWLGGESGLGVYMNAVRHSYAIDKMFAVIILVIILSLALLGCVSLIEKKMMPWRKFK